MRTFLFLVASIALIAGGAVWWRIHEAETRKVVFRTAPVTRGDLTVTISATGTLEPEEVVDVGARVVGEIQSLGRDPADSNKAVDYGSQVKVGTVLAQLDDTIYRAQVDQARANLQHAEADLLQSQARLRQRERDFKRAKNLRATNAISQQDYDTALAEYEVAQTTPTLSEAAIEQAKATLQQAEINLGYTTIKSPVDGVIIDRRVNVGQTVVSNLNAPSLFLIAKDLKRLQIWVSVNEADIGQIKDGQRVHFSVDAYPGEVFTGELGQVRLNASTTQNVVTYTVVVDVDNSDQRLKPYMTASVQFDVDQHKNILMVPNAALRWRPPVAQMTPEARAAAAEAAARRSGPREQTAPTANAKQDRRDKGIAWIEENGLARPLSVRVGATDGVMTEISGEGISEQTEVLVGIVPAATAGTAANPFTPSIFNQSRPQQ